MPDTIVETIYLMPQLLPVFSILRVDCLHAFSVHPKILSRLLTVCTVVCVILFITYSLCTPQQNSKAKIDSPHIWFACLVPVAPIYVPPSNDNIYKYMAYAFRFIYSVSNIAIFWPHKISFLYLPTYDMMGFGGLVCQHSRVSG